VGALHAGEAPWSAVAAATAFPAIALARLGYEAKAEGGSCCYRTPRRFAQSQAMTCHKWAGEVAPLKSQNVCQENKELRLGITESGAVCLTLRFLTY